MRPGPENEFYLLSYNSTHPVLSPVGFIWNYWNYVGSKPHRPHYYLGVVAGS